MSRHDLVERARAALRAGPPLALAVLFGSRSTGRPRPDSDVDLGIIPCDAAMSLWDEGRLAADLEAALGLPVDLVRLDRAPTLVRWEVVRSATLLVSEPAEMWQRFVARVLAEHADYGPAAEHVARASLRQLAAPGAP